MSSVVDGDSKPEDDFAERSGELGDATTNEAELS